MKKQPEITDKTRQKFVDAFWDIAVEKPISKISVSELTRRAGYNRSTFYEYFLDTDDLLTYVESALLEEIKQTVSLALPEENSPEHMFRILFTSLNERLYVLIGPNGDSGFLSRIRAELVPIATSYLPIQTDLVNFDYLACYVNSAMFGLMQHWNEKGKNISAEEISAIMHNLIFHGLQAYINTEPEPN